ncbi:MAG: hypothetical protein Q4D65_01740 [Peptostreptococcaceae bacterium]|nr:hypothetical protein [Peptostreptococcaceae bacterium]
MEYIVKSFVGSFFDGMSRAFDIFGSMRTKPTSIEGFIEKDIDALRSDWIVVGNDIRKGIGEYVQEEPRK